MQKIAFVFAAAFLLLFATAPTLAYGEKTVVLGAYSEQEYLKALVSSAYVGDDEALRMDAIEQIRKFLRMMPIEFQRRTLRLTILTAQELGFSQGTEFQNIYREAQDRGLALCPAEAGFALRLQHLDAEFDFGSDDSYLYIAMEPVITDDGPKIIAITPRDAGPPPWASDDEELFWVKFDSFIFIDPYARKNWDLQSKFVFVVP